MSSIEANSRSRKCEARPRKNVKFNLEPIVNASSVPSGQLVAVAAAMKLAKVKELLDQRASDVMSLWVPVTLSLLLVTLMTLIRLSGNVMDKAASRVLLAAEVSLVPEDHAGGIKLWQAILITVGGVVLGIVCISFLMIFLLKHKCFMCLKVYICGAFMMLTVHTISAWFCTASNALKFPVDWITVTIIAFNFMAIVFIAMGFGSSAPKRLVQVVHIVLSATIAYTFNVILLKFNFFYATCLGFIASAWDLFAVLCPRGPLNNLIKMAGKEQRVNTFMQPLIYTAAVWNVTVVTTAAAGGGDTGAAMTNRNADNFDNSSSDEDDNVSGSQRTLTAAASSASSRERQRRTPAASAESPAASAESAAAAPKQQPKRGTRLGLGDFIFYGMLTAAAIAECGLLGGLACYVGLFFGFCATLIGLTLLSRPLPALPLPVSIAIVMVSLTKGCGLAWSNTLADRQIVV